VLSIWRAVLPVLGGRWRQGATAGSDGRVTVRLTRELTATGIDSQALGSLQRQGRLARIRHGAYSESAEGEARAAHLQLVEGTWPLLGEHAVLSHGSAAALWNLPLWGSVLGKVSITRSSGGHGALSRYLHVWRASLADVEVSQLDGYRVTSLERTAFDVARSLPYERAVAVLDAALHRGADPGVLDAIIRASARKKGVATARTAQAFADERSESVGESISRVRMAEVKLPAPTLQFIVVDRFGRFVARSDFCWPERRVVGEFDGRIKYRHDSPDDVAAVVMDEKRREQAIRDAGWWVVRWSWEDLADRVAFRGRILQAFASAPA
jgi:predicted transcriptional regulator of viral defense system